ncbi:hypothetical protein SCOR_32125 [Sulfidibacter corallicola]
MICGRWGDETGGGAADSVGLANKTSHKHTQPQSRRLLHDILHPTRTCFIGKMCAPIAGSRQHPCDTRIGDPAWMRAVRGQSWRMAAGAATPCLVHNLFKTRAEGAPPAGVLKGRHNTAKGETPGRRRNPGCLEFPHRALKERGYEAPSAFTPPPLVLTGAPSSRQGVTPDDASRSRPYRAGDRGLPTTRVTVPQRHLTLRCTVSPLRGARWWRARGPRSKSMVVQSDVRSHLQRDPGRVPIHIDDRFGIGSRQSSVCREIQDPLNTRTLTPAWMRAVRGQFCMDGRGRSDPCLAHRAPEPGPLPGCVPFAANPGGMAAGAATPCLVHNLFKTRAEGAPPAGVLKGRHNTAKGETPGRRRNPGCLEFPHRALKERGYEAPPAFTPPPLVLTGASSSRQGVTPDDASRSRPYRAGDRGLPTTRVTVPQRHLTLRCTVSPLRGARWWRASGPRSKSMVVQSDVRSHLQRDPGRVPIHIDDRFGTGSRQSSVCREIHFGGDSHP